ncbi:MAG: hypothetical protein LBV42_02330 [Methanobrevibacter sp.]|jgi:predicted nuclease with TOPRIM domain|nr:hypothetical protein [Methanobrevibacter sp.]
MAFNNESKKNKRFNRNLRNNESKEQDSDLNILNFIDSSFDTKVNEEDSNLDKNKFDFNFDNIDFGNDNSIFKDSDNQNSYLNNNSNSINDSENNEFGYLNNDFNDKNDLDVNNEYNNLNNVHASYLDFNQDGDYDENKSFVDVRIITDDLNKAGIISKSIKNMDWINDLPVTISSIIPTNDLKIIINAVKGADIVLVTVDHDFNENISKNIVFKNTAEPIEDTYNGGLNKINNEFKEKTSYYENELKDFVNYLGILKFPKTNNHDLFNNEIFQKEVKNSIINVGLKSVFNISKLKQVNKQLNLKNKEFSEIVKLNEKLNIYHNISSTESENLKNENNQLKDEVKVLNLRINEITADFKNKFSSVDGKNLLEIFKLSELWEDSFNEVLSEQKYVILATNKFKPDNIVIGQDSIGALSKGHAVEWLKIIKTALIFLKLDLKDDNFS